MDGWEKGGKGPQQCMEASTKFGIACLCISILTGTKPPSQNQEPPTPTEPSIMGQGDDGTSCF